MKKLVIALMAFALVITLAGCGGGGGGSDHNDHGAYMKENFPEAYKNYETMTSNIKTAKATDRDGSKRADCIMAYVSDSAFKANTRASMSMTKKELRDRLIKLFYEVEYGSFAISPLNTTDSNKEENYVIEATQFIFAGTVKYHEKTASEVTLTLNEVKWEKIGDSWKITDGLNDLMKSISTLEKEGKAKYKL